MPSTNVALGTSYIVIRHFPKKTCVVYSTKPVTKCIINRIQFKKKKTKVRLVQQTSLLKNLVFRLSVVKMRFFLGIVMYCMFPFDDEVFKKR